MTQYGFVVDTHRCLGCHSCAVACKVANNLPEGMNYNRVLTQGGDFMDTADGAYPSTLYMSFLPMTCQHCDKPACVAACPTGATQKDEETGIVTQDLEACIGCKSCIAACPYDAVRTLQQDDPVYSVDFAVGNPTAPVHRQGAVEKCIMCYEDVKNGGIPACMDLCPGRARYWGDFDDPESDVSKLIKSREAYQLNVEAGTGPNVYYIK